MPFSWLVIGELENEKNKRDISSLTNHGKRYSC